MLIKRWDPSAPKPSEITPKALWLDRRRFLAMSAGTVAAGALLGPSQAWARNLPAYREGAVTLDEDLTDRDSITSYNNFYEFGPDKSDPKRHAAGLVTDPWTVTIEGECARPGVVDVDALMARHDLEERIYRLRCVEAWSMVIPWVGMELGPVLKAFEPTANAKWVEFTTLFDPEQMPGQRRDVLPWPYVEALRMDEAMHPLTMLAVGLYGEVLPPQNGAPLRLVVPWKYGFKSIKSIVKIRFTEEMPRTTWNIQAPSEYGIFANVNPRVSHPRWSQRRERRIGEFQRRETLMFNGYEEQVAGLYAGMDLAKWY
ncbi:protein-methionine-sulfoxide reductase catalytic subunit MsrP [Telmatospirillum sp. J64-1]|uniref:protein-methionine-sulfoxide reductase catalytic subunit MsrP n=1 Tax=Telmatospirillum sp. J64-1 TaxID=2502183 RepID=UPI00115E38D4|nr:protein-methionine-sulfoxide reductase catalytic subunit MsrP [Telmatospirillum sp. J64-1]